MLKKSKKKTQQKPKRRSRSQARKEEAKTFYAARQKLQTRLREERKRNRYEHYHDSKEQRLTDRFSKEKIPPIPPRGCIYQVVAAKCVKTNSITACQAQVGNLTVGTNIRASTLSLLRQPFFYAFLETTSPFFNAPQLIPSGSAVPVLPPTIKTEVGQNVNYTWTPATGNFELNTAGRWTMMCYVKWAAAPASAGSPDVSLSLADVFGLPQQLLVAEKPWATTRNTTLQVVYQTEIEEGTPRTFNFAVLNRTGDPQNLINIVLSFSRDW